MRNIFGDSRFNVYGERIDNTDEFGDDVGIVCGQCGFWKDGVCRRWGMRKGSMQDAELCSDWANKHQYDSKMFEDIISKNSKV